MTGHIAGVIQLGVESIGFGQNVAEIVGQVISLTGSDRDLGLPPNRQIGFGELVHQHVHLDAGFGDLVDVRLDHVVGIVLLGGQQLLAESILGLLAGLAGGILADDHEASEGGCRRDGDAGGIAGIDGLGDQDVAQGIDRKI